LTITDDVSNSYSSAITYAPVGHSISGIYYAKNVIGATSITVSADVTTNACISAWVTDLFNVDTTSPLTGTPCFGFCPITTTAANTIVLGTYFSIGVQKVSTGALGWPFYVPNTTNSTQDQTVLTVGQVETSVGAFTPQVVDPGGGINTGLTVAFKAATATPGSAPWYFGTSDFPLIMWNVFPNLANVVPSTTVNGDTGVDVHVGQHILSHDKSTAYPGNDSASTLVLTTTAAGYTCHVGIKCQTAVSTATVIPSIIYTSDDTASTVETIAGGTATCTTLGTSDVVSMAQEVHAKAATTIYLLTALANSPHYNTDAFCELHTVQ
jgi:hypothetical protein